jgi:hypothetical protein
MPRTLHDAASLKAPPASPPRSPRVAAAAAPLTPGRRRLLELMHRLHYGKVENLPVAAGEPRLDAPGVRVVAEVKFATTEAAPPPSPLPADYVGRPHVAALLRLLDDRPDDLITVLEIKHGTPFLARVIDNPTAPAN